MSTIRLIWMFITHIPVYFIPSYSIMLHVAQVGCSDVHMCARAGWLVADALASVTTHFVTQAHDLRCMGDASVGLVYSSHTLEHLSHQNPPAACPSFPVSTPFIRGESSGGSGSGGSGSVVSCWSELDSALSEWRRVLVTNGRLLVSVPDIKVLFQFFLDNKSEDLSQREILRNILFGGQRDQFDFHKNGFYFEYLEDLLSRHGFCNITRVISFDIFEDTSAQTFFHGESFSINVHAVTC
jgi:predicted SAM-dependent methyltransferase